MLIVLFCIFAALLTLAILGEVLFDWEFSSILLGCIGGIGMFVVAIIFSVMCVNYININKNPERIEILEQHNAEIDAELKDSIDTFMQYESKTYTNFYNKDAASIIVGIPTLKSDSLVASRIKEYTSNKDRIMNLKLEMVNQSIRAWWMYFGK